MKEKRWLLKEDYEIEDVDNLEKSLGVDRIIATLLVERGITTFDEAKKFFRPSLDQLHDPFLMKDMDCAVDRINEALERKERILIYGDYDVDGTSAVALVYSYLHTLTKNLDFYIPDREREGYGISFQGIDYAESTGVKLIIALDCGIKAIEQVDYALERGIDCIIGDHHLPGDELPKAVALLDPKRSDCPYPYKELSGCGIGFKIIEAHLKRVAGVGLCDDPNKLSEHERQLQDALKLHLLKYLDLVVVSIASDIVPITGENRVLAHFGLKVINTHPRPGIEALLRFGHIAPRATIHSNEGAQSGTSQGSTSQQSTMGSYFEKELTISDLVFLVGPRINAAGRIHDARDSVNLLLLDDIEKARKKANDINEYNLERKKLDSEATTEAIKRIDSSEDMRNRKSIVLYDEQWHKGVVGIVASRLVEAYYKPAIVFTRSSEDMLVGSARSIKEFDIHTALEKCSHLLEHFGGHKCAAGVSLKPENFDEFVKTFEEIVCATLPEEALSPEVEIDAQISFSEHITPKNLRILKQFSPFGPGNEVPVFESKNLVDTGYPRIVGTNHLKFSAIQLDTRSRSFPAIAFKQAEHYERIKRGDSFDICYQLEENYWNGRTEIQLNVKDIHFSE